MLGLVTEFSALATAQDVLSAAEGTPTTGTVAFDDNSITVGNGNNTIFANVGEYLVPNVAFAEGSGSLASNALALDSYLLDMQEVFGDMSFVVNQAGLRVIASYAATTPVAPATHLLDIGNDTIVDGSGNDFVVGDNGFVIMPEVGASAANWTTGVSTATLASVQLQVTQQQTTFDAALKAQFAADHPFTASDTTAEQQLFTNGTAFDLDIGNDTIEGGGGNSTLIGDDALILDPVVGLGTNASSDAASFQSIMVTAVDRLFEGPTSLPIDKANSWGVTTDIAATHATDWSSSGGFVYNQPIKSDVDIDSDTISAGAGSDKIYGDMAVIMPSIGSTAGLFSSFFAYPVGQPGQTGTPSFGYVYGFGPFGSLQQWASDAGSASKYDVDADTITGGAGNNVIFGELGDDTITGGLGNDMISGGYGFNRLSGGHGVNDIVFDRATDTYVAGGGQDFLVSSLNTTAGSPILAIGWQSAVATELANGMVLPSSGPFDNIQTDGSTVLAEIANNYYLYQVGGPLMAELSYGSPTVAAGFNGFTPVGAVQTATGYDIVSEDTATGKFIVWSTNSSGKYTATLLSAITGVSYGLESFEPIFHQDLNGDHVIGLNPTVIQIDGATSLDQIGSNYFLFATGTTTGSELKDGTSYVVAGQFPGFNPIAAVKTTSGYDVAWEDTATSQFMVWSTTSSGVYTATILSAVTGVSYGLESLEPTFGLDLNGDHVIGLNPTVIQTDNSTSLDQIGSNYFLFAAGTTTGVELKQGSAPVTAGQMTGFNPIAGVKTASGYDVAWEDTATDKFTVWSINASGVYTAALVTNVAATNTTLEGLELVFDQDLNGDGVIDTPTTVINATGYVLLNLNLNQAVKIAAGATVELAGSDSGSVTFSAATGTLIIDQAAGFTGQVIGLKGTGKVSSSDVIDLRNVAFATATKSFSGTSASATLTVGDGTHTGHLLLSGNYLTSTFFLSSDGHSGTDVIDPPLAQASFDTSSAQGGAAVSLPPATESGIARQNGNNGALTPAVLPAIAGLGVGPELLATGAAFAPPALNGSPVSGSDRSDHAQSAVPALNGHSTAVADGSSAPTGAVAREVVSAADVIRAIKSGDIAIKHADAAADRMALRNRLWLFDDAEGTFIPPAPEPLTIVIDRVDRPAVPGHTAETVGLVATAAMISTESSWLGALREFGRKAARVVQQRTRWM
jgi:hypothetical protein